MGFLLLVPESLMHHVEHGRKHPVSLYATSLRKIMNAWNSALDRLDSFRIAYIWAQDDSGLGSAMEAYRPLLNLLYEHLDVSYGCLRALVPAKGDQDPLFDTQVLDRAKIAGWKEFRQRVKPYTQDRLGAVVNSLKHNQSELTWFYFHKLPDIRPGYYLRDVLPSGALGPAPRAHPDGNSAFSFSRDMLLHFWNLYYISGEIATLMRGLVELPRVSTPDEQGDESLSLAWESLAARIAQLPLEFFPDELKLPCPLVRWNPSARELSIDMPGAVRPRKLSAQCTAKTEIVVNAKHLANKMPYFGRNGV